MDNVTNNLSFDQLPKAVGELLTKVDYVISRLDEKKDADGASPTQDDDQMMTMEEACQFIGKKRSTMYSLTSERRIPYCKRGNKLYFFMKKLVEWIQSGGASEPYRYTSIRMRGIMRTLTTLHHGNRTTMLISSGTGWTTTRASPSS